MKSGRAGRAEAPRATCVIPPIRVEASSSMLISPSIRPLGGLMGYGRGREGPSTFCVFAPRWPPIYAKYIWIASGEKFQTHVPFCSVGGRSENDVKDCSDYYGGIVVYRTTVTRRATRRITTLGKPLEQPPATFDARAESVADN